MLQQRVRAALRAWHTRAVMAAALVLLVSLAGGEFAAARQVILHEATSLEIIAWTQYDSWETGQRPPDVKVFDKTTTNLKLVCDVQNVLDNRPRGGWGNCGIGSPTYYYAFRFATFGVLTQIYSGDVNCAAWTVTTLGDALGAVLTILFPLPSGDTVPISGATLEGRNLMDVLHQRIGMPLPSGWSL
jgi:hypothetical protein